MIYTNNGKRYEVEYVSHSGATINVNGTTITDQQKMNELMGKPYPVEGYSVFCNSNELYFNTFDKAYDFATTKQKDTYSL